MMGIKLNAPSWATSVSDNMIIKAASVITKTDPLNSNIISDQPKTEFSPAGKKYLPWTCDSCSFINLSYPTLCEVCETANKYYIPIPLSHPTSQLPANQLDKLEEGIRRVMNSSNHGKLNQDWQSEIKSYIPKPEKKIIINNNDKTKIDASIDIIDSIGKKLKPAKKDS